MVNTLTDGERDILAELNREAEKGLCPICGEHFHAEEWYVQLPDEYLETEGGTAVPLAKCCPDCIDGFFAADAPCVNRCADGSMELC